MIQYKINQIKKKITGGCSQVVKTVGCGSIMRGFESRRSPNLFLVLEFFLVSFIVYLNLERLLTLPPG